MATSSIFATVHADAETVVQAIEASKAHKGKVVKVDVREVEPGEIKLMFPC